MLLADLASAARKSAASLWPRASASSVSTKSKTVTVLSVALDSEAAIWSASASIFGSCAGVGGHIDKTNTAASSTRKSLESINRIKTTSSQIVTLSTSSQLR